MRRYRIIARILLIFSFAKVALAAPAVVRQRHLDVAESAQKRGNEANQATVSEPMPESADSGPDPHFSVPESPYPDSDVESLSKWLPGSPVGSEHSVSDTESLSGWLAQDPAPPKSNNIFSDDLIRKLKKVAIWGTAAVISAGVTYGILKKTTSGGSSVL
jgi:hypothetical protein